MRWLLMSLSSVSTLFPFGFGFWIDIPTYNIGYFQNQKQTYNVYICSLIQKFVAERDNAFTLINPYPAEPGYVLPLQTV